jgi:hypothetical protein
MSGEIKMVNGKPYPLSQAEITQRTADAAEIPVTVKSAVAVLAGELGIASDVLAASLIKTAAGK